MRTITIPASQIQAAVARAQQEHVDWQAQVLEILLIPKVLNRWQEANRPRFIQPTIQRHRGFRWSGGREQARQVTDWSLYGGYTFAYGSETSLRWNSVRADYYSHSPSTCWDGVRRETNHSFLESLREVWWCLAHDQVPHWRVLQNLDRYRIQVVDDLTGQGTLNPGR